MKKFLLISVMACLFMSVDAQITSDSLNSQKATFAPIVQWSTELSPYLSDVNASFANLSEDFATTTAAGLVEEATTAEMESGAGGKFPDAYTIFTFMGGLKTEIVSIGDWNMDASPALTVAHGLTASDIRSVTAIIYDDAGDGYIIGAGISVYSTQLGFGLYGLGSDQPCWDATNFYLQRTNGGFFDGTDFNATSYNRGYIIVQTQ